MKLLLFIAPQFGSCWASHSSVQHHLNTPGPRCHPNYTPVCGQEGWKDYVISLSTEDKAILIITEILGKKTKSLELVTWKSQFFCFICRILYVFLSCYFLQRIVKLKATTKQSVVPLQVDRGEWKSRHDSISLLQPARFFRFLRDSTAVT